jgi:DNA invertase Pin-like site-specific DNA recombinase
LRCAVYTRKSSEEGLEQEFNSLHAQREACEAFIKSQRHEGWACLSQPYDDGGRSGGMMERPALQQLLADIRAGKVDVVVYKIDRLTRALADFAKIVEIFDQKGVSFVSVTQQFNTTTSMGRLTLNVLLSFAQFEREVTGERIRDKIAASNKKGMWMGGVPPLGYQARGRRLIINPVEAETVRHISAATLRSARLLTGELEAQGITSKRWTSASGHWWGGVTTRICRMLAEPVGVLQIIEQQAEAAADRRRLVDRAGELARDWPGLSPLRARVILLTLIHRIEVRADGIEISLLSSRLGALLDDFPASPPNTTDTSAEIPVLTIAIPAELRRTGKGVAMIMDSADPCAPPRNPDGTLIRAIARAHRFNDNLVQGKVRKFGDLARSAKLHRFYLTQLLRLAYLAPDITAAILDGKQPARLTATRLIEYPNLPVSWRKQRRVLEFPDPA